jgi:hypothetical protein
MKKINVLGTEYTVEYEDLKGEGIDGFCDFTSRRIVIRSDNENGLENFEANQKKQLRHEIIHAFLSESGLQANFEHCNRFGHEETMVDWIAIQFPKLLKAFEAADCL